MPHLTKFCNKIHSRFLENPYKKEFVRSFRSPGWIGDNNKAIGVFDRWYERPEKAKKLYWKWHTENI